MPSQFEVFAKCPNTGLLVSTGHVVTKSVFDDDKKPCGSFNCSSCNNVHFWSSEDVQILETHK